MFLYLGMAWHEAFEKFARHQVGLGGICNCILFYALKQDVI